MHGRLILAALAGFFAVFAPAQEPPRRATAGRVLDLEGQPVASARVLFSHRPAPEMPDVGTADQVRVTTDDRGRFRAELLQGRVYSAWAHWQGSNEGATRYEEGLTAGSFVTLRSERPVNGLRVAVRGAEPWGPLTWQVATGSNNMDHLLLVEENGLLLVPPIPRRFRPHLEAIDSKGRVLGGFYARGKVSEVLEVTLPAPVELPVRVTDRKTGAPIVGATLSHRTAHYSFCDLDLGPFWQSRLRTTWIEVGTTDARGQATVRLPLRADPRRKPDKVPSAHLLATAPGYQLSFSGWENGRSYRDGQFTEALSGKVAITLAAAEPVTGRLTGPGGTPWAQRTVACTFLESISGKRSSHRMYLPPLITHSDGEGRFTFPSVPSDGFYPRPFVTLLEPVDLEQATRRFGCPPPPAVAPWFLKQMPRELGTASVGLDAPFRLQVLDATGGPLARALVRLSKLGSKGSQEYFKLHATDNAGRVTLALPAGKFALIVVHDDHYAVREIDTAKNGEAADVLRLTLQPMPVVSGRVVDTEGNSVAGAWVSVAGSSVSSNRTGKLPSPNDAHQVNSTLLNGRTDSEGHFRLPYLPCKGVKFELVFWLQLGGRALHGQFHLDCHPDKINTDLEVELPKKGS